MSDFEPDTPEQPMRTRPYGSSPIAISIAVIVLVGALVAAGVLLILNQDDNDEDSDQSGVVATATTDSGSQPTQSESEEPTAPAETPTAVDGPTEPTATATGENGSSAPTPSPTEDSDEATATDSDANPTQSEPTGEAQEPTPTAEPFTGDFGVLPPAQLPSGGVSNLLELDYQLGMSLEELPASATVYLIEWPVLSLDEAQAIAQRFGLQGEVVEEGVGIYRVETESGSLFISPSETIFRAADPDTNGDLPSDDVIIDAARDWLTLSGFAGNNTDSGTIVGRDDQIGRAVVAFRPSSPSPILAPTPSATITIGPEGSLVEARISWPSSLIPSDYGLIAPIDLWSRVVAGQGFVEADLAGIDTSEDLTATATITGYSIAYTLAGGPAEDQYLVPVVSFQGLARIDRTGDEIDITVSVPSVYAEVGSIG